VLFLFDSLRVIEIIDLEGTLLSDRAQLLPGTLDRLNEMTGNAEMTNKLQKPGRFSRPDLGLIDELERELDLAGCAGGFADFAKSGAVQDVSWQAHVHNIEEVEEF
jgi:hypothetical protein